MEADGKMTEKSFMDNFKLVGSIGAALVGLSGFAIGTFNSMKKATEIRDDKKKEKELSQSESTK